MGDELIATQAFARACIVPTPAVVHVCSLAPSEKFQLRSLTFSILQLPSMRRGEFHVAGHCNLVSDLVMPKDTDWQKNQGLSMVGF